MHLLVVANETVTGRKLIDARTVTSRSLSSRQSISPGGRTSERFSADRESLARWAEQWRGRVAAVAIEATTGWRWVWRELAANGFDVRLAEPVQTRALLGRRRSAKTDRLDARASIASAKPVRPSVQTKMTSLTPRFLSSVSTLVQKRAPSVFSIQSPRQSRVEPHSQSKPWPPIRPSPTL